MLWKSLLKHGDTLIQNPSVIMTDIVDSHSEFMNAFCTSVLEALGLVHDVILLSSFSFPSKATQET